jgi:dihydroxyacetone kinase-like predicted kinase
VKELLEQLKMKKSSAKQQPEVEKLKPQSEKVHQTLILDLAQRKRLQQQMQQVRLSLVFCHGLTLKPKMRTSVKVRDSCLTAH